MLERMLYQRSIHPTIVKTQKLNDIWEEVAPLQPAMLKDFLKQLFPRVTGAAETALATPKIIRTFNMISFPASPLIIEELAQDRRVEKIFLDRMMYTTSKVPDAGVYEDPTTQKKFTTTYWTRRMLGLEEANVKGWTGKGIIASVIDTGAGVHEQLPHIEHRSTMTGMYTDGSGHGTHVASILGGKPAEDRAFRVWVSGMALDARLISIKSLGYVIGYGKESDILEAMELSAKIGADIVNLSLGSTQVTEKPEDDPQVEAIKKLTEEYKILVCCAAGNSGPEPGTINSPGVAPDAITVGAWDEINGGVASFSSRGPTKWGDVKPDFVAPGVRVDSGCVNLLDLQGDKKPQRYSYLCGTSISTPHLSGLLACARQLFRTRGVILTSEMVKDIGEKLGEEKNNETGWGLLTWNMIEEYFNEYIS
jgi:subtilisin family serine protease